MMHFSLVVCTYNPDNAIFPRVLRAIDKLASPVHADYEVIIVDNNSSMPVSQMPLVKELQFCNPKLKVIVETKPGLTSARLAGANVAKGNWIIFFDDDNEPSSNYLLSLEALVTNNPLVGCWGPGVVNVQYIGNNYHPWFIQNKQLFQEKKIANVQFDCKYDWQECYPFGTGLCVKQKILEEYKRNMLAGKYTLTDRIGKKLVSGGDTQLVLQGIKQGYFAGTSPSLQLEHLISDRKLKFKYMLKQVYMTATCYVRAFNEIQFPSRQIELRFSNNREIIRTVYSTFRIHSRNKPIRDVLILLYGRMGEINARYFAAKIERRPMILNLMERLIDV